MTDRLNPAGYQCCPKCGERGAPVVSTAKHRTGWTRRRRECLCCTDSDGNLTRFTTLEVPAWMCRRGSGRCGLEVG